MCSTWLKLKWHTSWDVWKENKGKVEKKNINNINIKTTSSKENKIRNNSNIKTFSKVAIALACIIGNTLNLFERKDVF